MTDPRRESWLVEIQRPPQSIPAKATRPIPLLFDAQHRPIETVAAWNERRNELRKVWTDFLGTIPRPEQPPVAKVIAEERLPGVVRQLVQYEAESGLPIEGYFLRPEGSSTSKRPGAVVFHSTDDSTIRQPAGLSGTPDKHIGLHLARRGYVTFCPRNYLWEYGKPKNLGLAVEWLKGRHPRVTGMEKMLFDAFRAVDLLASQPDVDVKRLGAIGHSLGAKEVLYLAAFDDRIRATVSSEGGIGLTYSNWEAPWYLGKEIQRAGFPLDHGQILGMIAPRAFLLLGGESADGDSSWPYIEAGLPVWKLLGKPEAIGLYNHRKGHAYPKEAQDLAYRFLDHFLDVTPKN